MVGARLVVEVLAGQVFIHRQIKNIAVERIDLLGRGQIHRHGSDAARVADLAAERQCG